MPTRYANLEELPYDPTARVDSQILVRLPKGLHEALKDEAEILDVSLNALVVSRLVAEIWPCRIVEVTASCVPRWEKPRRERPCSA